MARIDDSVGSAAIPSVEGIASKKKPAPQVEIATDSGSEILEVTVGKTIETRLTKVVKFENRQWPYILALPVMWLLTLYVMAKKAVYRLFGVKPRTNTVWFDGLGKTCRRVKDGATSWRALDIIYNWQFGQRTDGAGVVDDFWCGMLSCQAVRNRFKVVKQEVRRAILSFRNLREVRILSLAAGSAQAVVEVVAELRVEGFAPAIKVLLVDIDDTALEYAQQLARRHGVADCFVLHKGNVLFVRRIARDFQPHVIEMVGLLDYLCDAQAARLVERIQQSLPKNGVFLTCNICPNAERRFLERVVDWEMVYRTPGQLANVFDRSNFEELRLVHEPLKLHCLAVARN